MQGYVNEANFLAGLKTPKGSKVTPNSDRLVSWGTNNGSFEKLTGQI